MHGKGEWIRGDGKVWERGEWKRGLPEGVGTRLDANGAVFETGVSNRRMFDRGGYKTELTKEREKRMKEKEEEESRMEEEKKRREKMLAEEKEREMEKNLSALDTPSSSSKNKNIQNKYFTMKPSKSVKPKILKRQFSDITNLSTIHSVEGNNWNNQGIRQKTTKK